MMRVISLASGSKGNAYLIGASGSWLLIDDGLPYKVLKERMNALNVPLSGALVTHSHSDHISGLVALWHYERCPIYANAGTIDAIRYEYDLSDESFVCFENGQYFDVGGFEIMAFPIPHDDSDPVGYLVNAGDETYFHGTDIGTPLSSIGAFFAQADVATLESNHDVVMLRTSGRPKSLISRIAGPRGHLSNDQAADFVRRYASGKLKRIGLAHLSYLCNDASLAAKSMCRALLEASRLDVDVAVCLQDVMVEIM